MPIVPAVSVVVKERPDGAKEHRLEIDPSPPGAIAGAVIGAFFGPLGAVAGMVLGGILGPKANAEAPAVKDVTPPAQPQAEG